MRACHGFVLLVLVLASGLSLAAGPEAPASPVAAVLARLDRNADGRIDRGEYLEFRRPRFARADLDGNAALSPAEFEASLADGMRASAATLFATFDADRSGGLGAAEVDAWQASVFAQYLDADRDGTLSVAEVERMVQAAAPAPAPLDADGNGSVSAVEYVAFQSRRFPTHDMDADGGLSYTEFKASLTERAARTARDSFRGFDLNGNNRLSAREFVTYHDFVFRKFLDQDHDDAVTMEEFAARLQR